MGTIKADFYRVEISETGNLTFEDLVKEILKKTKHDRVLKIRAVPVWLNEATCDPNFVEGDLVRLRMSDIPVKGDLSGKIENFQLNDNEGIGEQTAFLYHIPTKVLILQSKKGGVSPSNLAKYLTEVVEIKNTIFLDPVLHPEALKKLEQMSSVNKFEIKVAGLENLQMFSNQDYALKEITEMSNYFQSPYISINFSVGNARSKSLSLNAVTNFAKSLMRLDKNVKKLRISGDIDEDSLYLDLLKDRMREEIDGKFSGRTSPYSERKKALKDVWHRNEQQLIKMFLS